MTDSIYEPPSSSLEDSRYDDDFKLASTGQRFLNFIIDTIFYYLLAFASGIIIGLLEMWYILEGFGGTVFSIGLMVFYYLFTEAIWGRSLAKLITRTKVISQNNEKITFGQALGRSLVRLVPFEPFSFLGGNGTPRGWHDSWSKTKVVSVRK
jgi:uncharacterized RDD family membrane protein YckC